MNVTVIGSGYVGTVAGVCLASIGHQVVCADTDLRKITLLSSGKAPFYEEGLEPFLHEASAAGRIRFTAETDQAVRDSDIVVIAVGTPSRPNGEADLSGLWSIINRMAESAGGDCGGARKLLVVKSTVPVGTCDSLEAALQNGRVRDRFVDVVHNPEFLRQGSAVRDFMRPDRIVVGCETEEARAIMSRLYAGVASPVHYCDRRGAELIKYGANAFLAMKISFANMLADLSDKLGIDVEQVTAGIGADQRIGSGYLRSGVGYGGSCFPKDMLALQALGKSAGCELPLLEATERINAGRPQTVADKLKSVLGTLQGARIALLGLAFKPMSDDIREAPSLSLSRLCLAEGAEVHTYDPLIRSFPVRDVVLHGDSYSAAEGCDAVVLLTEWEQFRTLDWSKISRIVRTPLIVDGRNMMPWNDMQKAADECGLIYLSVGRPDIRPYGLTSPGVTPQYLRNTRVK